MDRILDSGSNDWGSTPHGCTRIGGFGVAYFVEVAVILIIDEVSAVTAK